MLTRAASAPILPSRNASENPFPAFSAIHHGQLLSIPLSLKTTELTHGLHRFPAKFVPQVPKWAIEEFSSSGELICDPFSGSGTTAVEAIAAGRHAIGVDFDPLNSLIGRAKTYQYNLDRLTMLAEVVLAYKPIRSGVSSPPMSGVKNFEHWFTLKARQHLHGIAKTIRDLNCSDRERSFFWVVFSASLRWLSNADDQTQKTYVSGTSKKDVPDPRETFRKYLSRGLKGVKELSQVSGRGEGQVLVGDAARLPLRNASIDLIVTSPPYLDSVDYMYNFMLEYFWLGPLLGVPDRRAFNEKRRVGIGSKRPLARFDFPDELKDLINPEILPRERRMALASYLGLMKAHFVDAARVLKKKSRYVLVVGNSQTEAGMIPLHECLIRLAESAGLGLEKAFCYRIRRHYMKFPRKGRGGIILADWVIVLKNGHVRSNGRTKLHQPELALLPHEVAN